MEIFFAWKQRGDFRQSVAMVDNVFSVSQSKSVMGILGDGFFCKKLKFLVVKNDGAENLRKDSPDICLFLLGLGYFLKTYTL